MRVLVISHTVFDKSNNTGKTLLSHFGGFSSNEVAQFFVHSEIPVDATVCHNYYRFTDIDALKSIPRIKKLGRAFSKADIQVNRISARDDRGLTSFAYRLGEKRTAGIYIVRNAMWRLANWFTEDFRKWLQNFQPEIVYFASGDYAFMYRIAEKIADYLKIPLVVFCMDDYYLQNSNSKVLGSVEYNLRMKIVRRVMGKAACILTICEEMKNVYESVFRKPCYTIYTSAKKDSCKINWNSRKISYIGNLGFNRYLQLLDIGRALRAIDFEGEAYSIDLYTGEKQKKVLKVMTEENGIVYHGMVSAEDAMRIEQNSMLVIHTESFDPIMQNKVRFSMSTKIAGTLMNGPCLFAYGPAGIASMDYLEKNNAAYIVNSSDDLLRSLKEIINNLSLRKRIVNSARILAQKNHSEEKNTEKVRRILSNIIQA